MDESSDQEPISRCDYCRLPLGDSSVTLEREGVTYRFCSRSCRDAMTDHDHVFAVYHGFKRFKPGISALDAHLPQGLPRNSFVLLSGVEGTRDGAVHAELVWRTLERGEPAVIMSFQEPPISQVESFLTLDWNVLPYLERGQLQIIDCFTYRVADRRRMFDRLNSWNRYLHRVSDAATTTIRDPSDMAELQSKLDTVLEGLEMVDSGILLIDSLTELGTRAQPIQAYDFVKDVRADVCKGRYVTVFAGATYTGGDETFPHDLGYAVDGIVELEHNATTVEDALIKRIRIRKMNGVLTIPEWTAYEYTAGRGLVSFDPEKEVQQAFERRLAAESESEPPTESDGGSS